MELCWISSDNLVMAVREAGVCFIHEKDDLREFPLRFFDVSLLRRTVIPHDDLPLFSEFTYSLLRHECFEAPRKVFFIAVNEGPSSEAHGGSIPEDCRGNARCTPLFQEKVFSLPIPL